MSQNSEFLKCVEPGTPCEASPLMLKMREPGRCHDQRRPVASDGIGQLYTVVGSAEANVLVHDDREPFSALYCGRGDLHTSKCPGWAPRGPFPRFTLKVLLVNAPIQSGWRHAMSVSGTQDRLVRC